MCIIQRHRSLTICVGSNCFERLLLSVSTASAELHEDFATAVAAVNPVSLTVKAFVGPAERTFVVYKFRHSLTDLPIGFEPVRQNLISETTNKWARDTDLGSLCKICFCNST